MYAAIDGLKGSSNMFSLPFRSFPAVNSKSHLATTALPSRSYPPCLPIYWLLFMLPLCHSARMMTIYVYKTGIGCPKQRISGALYRMNCQQRSTRLIYQRYKHVCFIYSVHRPWGLLLQLTHLSPGLFLHQSSPRQPPLGCTWIVEVGTFLTGRSASGEDSGGQFSLRISFAACFGVYLP